MNRDWQPGDVAIATLGDGTEVTVIRARSGCALCGAMRYEDHWHGTRGSLPGDYARVRPVVVINPDDRDQVERLTGAFYMAEGEVNDCMARALRSLVAPPRPDEPQGLGAVVEDVNGVRWTRTLSDPTHLRYWTGDTGSFQAHRTYDDLDVVRVLADGWRGEDQ